ncbi:MAG: carbamoyl-phosphate synthase small subunit [Clostridiales bacterium]|jgi:carbamoyl-phosphate synthase small subunit|nr:carbamoyl-phosphate synthase small subunit [Clostridiales bacterium]
MRAFLILEDGTVFSGEHFGANRDAVCEIVFNTGLTGYLELLTDASYAGQAIVMSSPVIGNYGVFVEHGEADRPWAEALIVRDLTHLVHDPRSAEDLDDYLTRHDIPGLKGVDTRQLTLRLREHGTMNGKITTNENFDKEEVIAEIRAWRNDHPVVRVSRKTAAVYPAGAIGRVYRNEDVNDELVRELPSEAMKPLGYKVDESITRRFKVAMLDFGLKQNIVWNLTRRGCEVTVYPWNTPMSEILAAKPDGVMLSNGPGDPMDCADILPGIRELHDSGVPTFAICLGHQLMALATGAKTTRLKYGHRGINHPVQDLATGRVYITSQNHGYVVIDDSIDLSLSDVSHRHLNDHSIEGLKYKNGTVKTVQYHPEGAPGPLDSDYLFDEFMKMMEV